MNYDRIVADVPALYGNVLDARTATRTGPVVVTDASFSETVVEQSDGSFLLTPGHAARYVFDYGSRLEPLLDYILGRGPAPIRDRFNDDDPDDPVASLFGALWQIQGFGADAVVVLTCARLGLTDTTVALSLALAGVTPVEVVELVRNGQPLPSLERLHALAALRNVQFA